MKEIQIKVDNKNYSFAIPDKLEEVNQEQFVSIVRYVYEKQTDISERMTDAIKLLWIFASKRKRKLKSLFSILAETGELATLIEENNLPFEKPEACRKWFVERVHIPFKNLYGPKDGFGNMTFGEFVHCDTIFLNYIQYKQPELLHSLAAILLRPKKSKVRIKYSEENFEKNKKNIKWVKWYYISSVFYNYITTRMYIAEKYPYIFPKNDKQENSESEEVNLEPNGWFEARATFVDNIADLSKLDEMNLHDVLFFVNNKIKNNAHE